MGHIPGANSGNLDLKKRINELEAEVEELNSKRPVNLYKSIGFTGATTNYELITTVTIPEKSFYVLGANLGYGNSKPTGVRICWSNNYMETYSFHEQDASHDAYEVRCFTTGYTEAETTFYIFGKWHVAAKNSAYVSGFYIPA